MRSFSGNRTGLSSLLPLPGGAISPGTATGVRCEHEHLSGQWRLPPQVVLAPISPTTNPGPSPGHLVSPPVARRWPLGSPPPCARRAVCVPSCLRRPSGGPDCLPRPSVRPRSPLASRQFAATRPFPQRQGSDTIPIACRPPVCACLSPSQRRQVRPVCRVGTGRHAQVGRFSSTRFTRRANSRGRGPVLREARRIKAYSLG